MTRADDLYEQLRSITAELTRLDTRPAEPQIDSIIRFAITYTSTRSTYRYAALRVGRLWYVTGWAHRCVTWDEMLDWLQEVGTTRFVIFNPGEAVETSGHDRPREQPE